MIAFQVGGDLVRGHVVEQAAHRAQQVAHRQVVQFGSPHPRKANRLKPVVALVGPVGEHRDGVFGDHVERFRRVRHPLEGRLDPDLTAGAQQIPVDDQFTDDVRLPARFVGGDQPVENAVGIRPEQFRVIFEPVPGIVPIFGGDEFAD